MIYPAYILFKVLSPAGCDKRATLELSVFTFTNDLNRIHSYRHIHSIAISAHSPVKPSFFSACRKSVNVSMWLPAKVVYGGESTSKKCGEKAASRRDERIYRLWTMCSFSGGLVECVYTSWEEKGQREERASEKHTTRSGKINFPLQFSLLSTSSCVCECVRVSNKKKFCSLLFFLVLVHFTLFRVLMSVFRSHSGLSHECFVVYAGKITSL